MGMPMRNPCQARVIESIRKSKCTKADTFCPLSFVTWIQILGDGKEEGEAGWYILMIDKTAFENQGWAIFGTLLLVGLTVLR